MLMAKLQLGKDLTKEEVADIVAFLNGLTGEFPKQKMPILPGTPGSTFKLTRTMASIKFRELRLPFLLGVL